MFKEFRKFILRGNVIDLAVAVAVGAAFTAVVNALVGDIFTPLIAAIVGKHDFSSLYFTVRGDSGTSLGLRSIVSTSFLVADDGPKFK